MTQRADRFVTAHANRVSDQSLVHQRDWGILGSRLESEKAAVSRAQETARAASVRSLDALASAARKEVNTVCSAVRARARFVTAVQAVIHRLRMHRLAVKHSMQQRLLVQAARERAEQADAWVPAHLKAAAKSKGATKGGDSIEDEDEMRLLDDVSSKLFDGDDSIGGNNGVGDASVSIASSPRRIGDDDNSTGSANNHPLMSSVSVLAVSSSVSSSSSMSPSAAFRKDDAVV